MHQGNMGRKRGFDMWPRKDDPGHGMTSQQTTPSAMPRQYHSTPSRKAPLKTSPHVTAPRAMNAHTQQGPQIHTAHRGRRHTAWGWRCSRDEGLPLPLPLPRNTISGRYTREATQVFGAGRCGIKKARDLRLGPTAHGVCATTHVGALCSVTAADPPPVRSLVGCALRRVNTQAQQNKILISGTRGAFWSEKRCATECGRLHSDTGLQLRLLNSDRQRTQCHLTLRSL